ncbi:MAG: L,D-transpeptidase family protein [Hahellaceae bacterium]|nr:L,D-transpeptidase family protein [Hahellaceae bacterium]MCP5210321.1 L,D-transpeptidase family protein [Hahellaceae bacterium]
MLRNLLLLCVLVLSANAYSTNESLRLRLEQWPQVSALSTESALQVYVSSCQILDPVSTRKQIEHWVYEPAFTAQEGGLNSTGNTLLMFLKAADELGLNPLDYHVNCLDRLLTAPQEANQGLRNDLEILLTDAFIQYLAHNRNGRLNPLLVHPEWFIKGRQVPTVENLESMPTADTIASLLRASEPDHPEYSALKAELKRLNESGPTDYRITTKLKQRVNHPEVAILADKLYRLGYLKKPEETTVFSANIESAVRRFQANAKLEADGIVGPDTAKALENAIHGNADVIKVNLERLRWLPEHFGDRYILVDIAGYQMQYWEDNNIRLSMRVIVGKSYRKTPIFNQRMRYVVLNPSWDPTHTIATKDLLPKIKNDPNYFSTTGMKVYKGWGKDQVELDPHAIDWQKVSAKNFPYRFRQPPGTANPLGKVKFMFPNEFDVYMHDTNNHALFSKQELSFSSGCIRLEKPLELLYALFSQNSKWPSQRLDTVLASNIETTVSLEQSLPVYLLYKTALLGPDGAIIYRKDIYERDETVLNALNAMANPQSLDQSKK